MRGNFMPAVIWKKKMYTEVEFIIFVQNIFSKIEIAFKINDKEIYYFPQKQCFMKLCFSEHKFDKTWHEK